MFALHEQPSLLQSIEERDALSGNEALWQRPPCKEKTQ